MRAGGENIDKHTITSTLIESYRHFQKAIPLYDEKDPQRYIMATNELTCKALLKMEDPSTVVEIPNMLGRFTKTSGDIPADLQKLRDWHFHEWHIHHYGWIAANLAWIIIFIEPATEQQLEYAKALIQEGLQINISVYGENHHKTGNCHKKYALILEKCGEYDKALDELEKALKVCYNQNYKGQRWERMLQQQKQLKIKMGQS